MSPKAKASLTKLGCRKKGLGLGKRRWDASQSWGRKLPSSRKASAFRTERKVPLCFKDIS
jgi:hypothetical protein